jgi:multidrug efflux pump subunit AcrA (membrane-fusion protein)
MSVAEEDYAYNLQNTQMLLDELQHDSLMNEIQLELLKNDLRRDEKSFLRSRERRENLAVKAPVSGQLSFVGAVPGERVSAGTGIGEIKIIEQFKVHARIGEYHIDRITAGVTATVTYQGEKYRLRVTKVNPEIKERQFEIDLVFTDGEPENIRIGKNYRLLIELDQPEDAIVVPKGDFFQPTGGQWIFKLTESGGKAVRQPISIGRQNPLQYEILDGLKPGDRVIVSGYENFGNIGEIILK